MPLRLTGSDETYFELALSERQLDDSDEPAEAHNAYDISFLVGTADDSWEETAPCMNPYELHTLVEWLEAVSRGEPEVDAVEILEANLSFTLDDQSEDEVAMRIGFHLEDRPAWSIIDAPTDEAGFITLRVGRDQVAAAATELRDDIASSVSPRG